MPKTNLREGVTAVLKGNFILRYRLPVLIHAISPVDR